MNFSKEEYEEVVRSHFIPQVLVLTSEETKKSCYKNHLEFVDMIRPYEGVCKTVYSEFAAGSIVVRDFLVRFLSVGDFKSFDEDSFHEYLHGIFRLNYDHERDIKQMLQVDRETRINRNFNYTPWFSLLREEILFSAIQCEHFEMFRQPTSLLIVASTNDPNPMKIFDKLYSEKNAPAFFKEDSVNTDIYKFFILLHDEENNTMTDRELRKLYQKMQNEFGDVNCKLLKINSRLKEEREKRVRIPPLEMIPGWEKHRFAQFMEKKKNIDRFKDYPEKGKGFYLSQKDLIGIRTCVEEFIKNGVIVSFKHFASGVLAKKKKRSKWKEKFNSLFVKNPAGPLHFDSPEYQTRKLADYAFMLQRYKFSLEQYNDVKNFKKRGSEFRANHSELVGISRFLGEDVYNTDMEKSLKEAVGAYLEKKQYFFAMRSVFFLHYMLRVQLKFVDAAECLVNMAGMLNEYPHLQAVLLEQAAFCYMMNRPEPLRRKYCFFMNLAANRYYLCQYYHHSYRCYSAAFKFYYSKDWRRLFEEFSVKNARVCAKLNKFPHSINHFHDFFSNIYTGNEKEQELYLRHFLKCANEILKNKWQEFSLELPEFDTRGENISVSLSHDFNYTKKEKRWISLRNDILKKNEKMDLNDQLEKAVEMNEIITIELEVFNRLSVPMKVTRLNLIGKLQNLDEKKKGVQLENLKDEGFPPHYFVKKENMQKKEEVEEQEKEEETKEKNFFDDSKEFVPPTIEKKEEENVGTLLNFGDVSQKEEETEGEDDDEGTNSAKKFECHPISFTLDPLEKRKVQLSIIPHEVGILQITSIFWEVENLFYGIQPFELKSKRLNRTREERLGKVYEKSKELHFNVIEHSPRFSVRFHSFPPNIEKPSELSIGEFKMGVLELENEDNEIGIQNIFLHSNLPSFFVVGKASTEMIDVKEFSAALLDKKGEFEVICSSSASPLDIIDPIPLLTGENKGLEQKKKIYFPIYFRGAKLGSHVLQMLLYYEPYSVVEKFASSSFSFLPFVFKDFEFEIDVKESLQVKPFVQPCLNTDREFLLGIKVSNETTKDIYKLEEIVSLSSVWKIKKGGESPVVKNSFVGPHEDLTFYLRIAELEEKVDGEKTLSHSMIGLNSISNRIDSTSSPYVDFFFKDLYVSNEETKDGKRLSLLFFWSEDGNEGKRFGQTNVINLPFSHELEIKQSQHPLLNKPERKTKTGMRTLQRDHHFVYNFPSPICPFQLLVKYEEEVFHDFGGERMKVNTCYADVVFQILNISLESTVSVVIRLFPPNEFFQDAYIWNGSTTTTFENIKPGEKRNLSVKAAFFTNGVFNLNQFKVYWKIDGEKPPQMLEHKHESDAFDSMMKEQSFHEIAFSNMEFLMHIKPGKKE